MNYKSRIGLLALIASLCWADGIFVHFSGSVYQLLPLVKTDLSVKIQDQVSNVVVEQTFDNPTADSLDVTYFMKLPLEASVVGFGVYKNGTVNEWGLKPGQGQGDTSGTGKKVPGLDDYLGKNRFIIMVAKVPPGENTFQLKYTELLPYDLGHVTLSYPLATGSFLVQPIESVKINVELNSQRKIEEVTSPTHGVTVNRHSDYWITINYLGTAVTSSSDFKLNYRLSQKDIGLWVLAYRAEDDKGFFLLTIEPGQDITPGQIVAKNFTFILDRSGSMYGKRIEQVKQAATYCISHLNATDYFNVIRYNDVVERFAANPILATSGNISAALSWIAGVDAGSLTDINQALLTGLGQYMGSNTANQILFLTDGRPTAGITDIEQILKNVREANTHDVSIFVFGVGRDVNHQLLDGLALQNHGLVRYVAEDEEIEGAITDLYIRIFNPVLIKTNLDYGTISFEDSYPPDSLLPDIFYGSQLRVFGRYTNFGKTTITLSGTVAGAETSLVYRNIEFPLLDTTYKFLPRSWAKAKIDYWLWWMSVYGKNDSIISMITDLSLEYGILTPYTSFGDTSRGIGEVADIQSFNGWYEAKSIVLTWVVGSRLTGATYNVYRWDPDELKYRQLNDGPLPIPRFVDRTIEAGNTYQYKLEAVVSNEAAASAIITVFAGVSGPIGVLDQIVPNFIRGGCQIRLTLRKEADVRLSIFDRTGRCVQELMNTRLPAGSHHRSWNSEGYATGVYFVCLRTGTELHVERLVVVR